MNKVVKLERPQKDFCYEIVLNKDAKEFEVLFAQSGNILKKETLKKDKAENK